MIPSEDGSLIYEFTPDGRHLSTIDSITGQAIYTFSYNSNGYLSTIEDLDGEVTQIERDGDTPKAIIAPKGQRTTLQLNDNGYLQFIINPQEEMYELRYSNDGLLQKFINPRGHQSTYRYDDVLGLLLEDTDAANGGWLIERMDNVPAKGYTTTMTSKEGRVTSYQVKPQTNEDLLRINTAPDGTQTQTLIKTDGETVMTSPDGTVIVSEQGPDPRFGMQAPFTKKMLITTPSGLTSEVNTEKTVALLDEMNPLAVDQLTTKVTTNGRLSRSVYEGLEKKLTTTSAEGRQTVSPNCVWPPQIAC